jgi:hypothetical protein
MILITTLDGDEVVAEQVIARDGVPSFIKALREVAGV